MPKLWNETIEAHRHDVREAILEATMALVAEHGPLSVTMSQIADKTGIGRATLYKYFVDVESILIAWHERQVTDHLASLAELRNQAADPGTRLRIVLETFALRRHEHHDPELAALVHRGEHMNRAHQRLVDLIAELLGEAATAGLVRRDIAPAELAVYCVHAISAAAGLPSKAAVERLVSVTLSGLRPDSRGTGTTARKRRSKKPA